MKKLLYLTMILSVICTMSSCQGKDKEKDKSEQSFEQSSAEIESSQIEESIDDTLSEESSEDVSDDNSGILIKVPEEYKELAIGKALSGIDTSAGYILSVQLVDSESVKYIEKGDCRRIIESSTDGANLLVIGEAAYFLDKLTKTYSIAEEYCIFENSLFYGMEYVETTEKEIGGVKYTVDKFNYTLPEDDITEAKDAIVIEFYTFENELRYVGVDGTLMIISFSFEDVDSYLQIPNDYTQISLKNIVEKYFDVPEEFKQYKLGQALDVLDVEKGFSIVLNIKDEGTEDIIGCNAIFKDSKAFFGKYDDNGYVQQIIYKNSHIYISGENGYFITKDVPCLKLGLYGNFFDGLKYIETREEEVEVAGKDDTITCTVESFSSGDGKIYDFYFNGEELFFVTKDGKEIALKIDASGNIDESYF